MTAGDQSPANSAAEVYRGFIDAVNRQDLGAAARFVDAARYRENCVRLHPRVRGLGTGQGIGPHGLEGPSRPARGIGPGPRRQAVREPAPSDLSGRYVNRSAQSGWSL